MKTFKIKCNEDLFNKMKFMGLRISNLSNIIQNDAEISKEEVNAWAKCAIDDVEELKNLIMEIHSYITIGQYSNGW